jgi:hypothetical protein
VPRAPARYDIALDAEDRWCVVIEGGPKPVAYCPATGRQGALEPPVPLVPDPAVFVRVQKGDPHLIRALIAWHVCREDGRPGPARVLAALAAALAGGPAARA